MKSTLTILALTALFITGCGEPKTYPLSRMHAINPSGKFFVEGKVASVGGGITRLSAGDVTFEDLRLVEGDTGYTFYFLPADHPRKPVVGDNVKLTVRFKVLDQSFAGGGRAPIIEAFEFK